MRWRRTLRNCHTGGGCKTLIGAPGKIRGAENGIDRGLSAYTLSTQRAALYKLYGCTARDFDVKLPERLRADIQRSRNDVSRDYGFSKEKNADVLAFARVTGLRRHELAAVKPEQIRQNANGSVTLCDVTGLQQSLFDTIVILWYICNSTEYLNNGGKIQCQSTRNLLCLST